MKQTLRLRGGVCIKKQPLLYSFYRLFITLTIVLVSCVCSRAQVSTSSPEGGPAAGAVDIMPLEIGDTIPEALWNMPLNMVKAGQEGSTTVTLKDFKEKLIILDFWATWCAPCIKSLSNLDSLQKIFLGNLSVVPITYEHGNKIQSFIEDKRWQLPSLVDETILAKYFPYRSLPNQVWIRDGKVMAVTGTEYATFSTIEKVINDEDVEMLTKRERIAFDPKKPLLVNGNGGNVDNMLFQSIITKRVPLRISGISNRKNGITAYNMDVFRLYMVAFSKNIPFLGRNNRVIFDIKEDSLMKRIKSPFSKYVGEYESDMLIDKWQNENTFCYSLNIPSPVSPHKVKKIMQNDLNIFFGNEWGINAKLKRFNRLCLVLTRESDRPIPNTQNVKNDLPLKSVKGLVAAIQKSNDLPVIDATGYREKVEIVLIAPLNDLVALNEELNRYGLNLTKEYREIEMLVFSKLEEDTF